MKETEGGAEVGADGAKRKEEGSGGVDISHSGRMSSETGTEETNWGRRVRSSTKKHKYLMKARLTGEQRLQRSLSPKTPPSPEDETGHSSDCLIAFSSHGQNRRENAVHNGKKNIHLNLYEQIKQNTESL